MTGLPLNGALRDAQLNVLEGEVGILLQGETIAKTGDFDTLLNEAKIIGAEVVELDGDFVALPGFIPTSALRAVGHVIMLSVIREKPIWKWLNWVVAFGIPSLKLGMLRKKN